MPRVVRVIVLVLSVLVLLVSLPLVAMAVVWSRAQVDTGGQVDFDTPLAIPPLASSYVDEEGRRVFDLDLHEGRHEFAPGVGSPTWGIGEQDYLGPTIRAERGEQVVLNVHNGVDETTSMHWHGMHLPAQMDGGPHQPIERGETWSPTWRIDQPAATLWYHPHPHGETAEHVYRGLAGMFILDEDSDDDLGLPDEYGVDDIPVIIQDKRLEDDGTLDDGSPLFSPVGQLGDTIAVNGTVGPYLDVTTERVRLRLLNASNARAYSIGFDDDREFTLVASDGGLLAAPVSMGRLMLSPGERAEIVVELEPGESTVLRSYPPDLGADFFTSRFSGGDDTLDLLELRADDTLVPSDEVAEQLADLPPVDHSASVRTRDFELQGTAINGRDMDMDRIDFEATVGETETWEVTNTDGTPHSFHVHDVQFRVLEVDGVEPPPELAGWKDTVYVRPGESMRLQMTFSDYTDPQWPYMFHCHVLRHEDQGMMGQFVVVEPGEDAEPMPEMDHHDH